MRGVGTADPGHATPPLCDDLPWASWNEYRRACGLATLEVGMNLRGIGQRRPSRLHVDATLKDQAEKFLRRAHKPAAIAGEVEQHGPRQVEGAGGEVRDAKVAYRT